MIYVDEGLRLELDLGDFVDDLILAMYHGSHLTINTYFIILIAYF